MRRARRGRAARPLESRPLVTGPRPTPRATAVGLSLSGDSAHRGVRTAVTRVANREKETSKTVAVGRRTSRIRADGCGMAPHPDLIGDRTLRHTRTTATARPPADGPCMQIEKAATPG